MYKDILVDIPANEFISGNLKTGDTQLSTHFRAAEFACPCCKAYKVHAKLLQGLEDMRTALGGKSITIVNPNAPGGQGYRCKAYALALAARDSNASPTTKHNDGTAADVKVSGVPPTILKAEAEKSPVFASGGIGIYSWGIHVDLGPRRRFDYR